MICLSLYSIFHLNLAYSSIEEEQRPEIMRRCYWPLLRLAREKNLPMGIEASGYTLETVAELDPAWLDELRWLTSEGPCEFIGSGYAQIIGPLVPAEVNTANLHLGNQVYDRLLGFRPTVAMVNEQTYSAGMVQHYLDAGYQAIVMEWNNPVRYHPEWSREWQTLPQRACGSNDESIPVIWNNAIAFQKFQRYVYGELELNEYLDYLRVYVASGPCVFPLYGNDVEIFDFRPGRYHTEPLMAGHSEWVKISALFDALLNVKEFRLIRPRQVLDLMQISGAGHLLHLESPGQPIPVKKQDKYNITRWAVTGRNNFGINSICWRIYEMLKVTSSVDSDSWRELCYLWSSDFRTHITQKRWDIYLERLAAFEKKVGEIKMKASDPLPSVPVEREAGKGITPTFNSHVESNGRFLNVEAEIMKVRLNCRRGLAIDGIWIKGATDRSLVGTLYHGFYNDISMGADYYTGHLVFEAPGQPKVTDLNPVQPQIEDTVSWIRIDGGVSTPLGPVSKSIYVYRDIPRIDIEYRLDWEVIPVGSLRLGHITLNPEAFERDTLFYSTHNGSKVAEKYFLGETNIDHGAAVSFLVSAKHAIGITDGVVQIGDAHHSINVKIDKRSAALIGLVTYRQVENTYFCRLSLSAREMDETSKTTGWKLGGESPVIRISLTIT